MPTRYTHAPMSNVHNLSQSESSSIKLSKCITQFYEIENKSGYVCVTFTSLNTFSLFSLHIANYFHRIAS